MKNIKILLCLALSMTSFTLKCPPISFYPNEYALQPNILQTFTLKNKVHYITETPLLNAVNKSEYQKVQLLLKKNRDTNTSQKKLYPMIIAAFNNDIVMMQLLRQHGLAIDNDLTIDSQILIAKLQQRHPGKPQEALETLRYILDSGTAVEGSLEFASNAAYAQLLIEYGADVNELDSSHITPLLRAVKRDNPELVALLLSYGAQDALALGAALQDAIDKYESKWLPGKVKSKTLNELCKRGASITKEEFARLVATSPEIKKHPKALQQLLKQCTNLAQKRIKTKKELLGKKEKQGEDKKDLPNVLVDLIDDFEAGQKSDSPFLQEKKSD